MKRMTRHDPGTFCWPELMTSDQDAAKAFYGALFGWTVDVPNVARFAILHDPQDATFGILRFI